MSETTTTTRTVTAVPLKDLVARAVDADWARFQAEHPRLAALIDREMLVSGAVAAIDGDPAYREALAAAAATGTAAETLAGVVRELVGKWVRLLIA